MMIGLGAGGYTAGVAHLFTHAIFKCMLFLCAGSVIHACHHLQDMNRMGGLRKKMPITFLTMLIGTLAISGVPLFSAFFSKDAILAASLARAMEMGGLHWLPPILGFITAGLTTFYMFRLVFMTFFGQPRDKHIYDHAHESPAVATVPLLILAMLCFGFWWAGGLNFPLYTMYLPGLSMTVQGAHGAVTTGWLEALITSPVPAHHSEYHEHLHHVAHVWATILSTVMLLIGLAMAFLMYIKRSINPDKLLEIAPLRHGFSLLSQLWFFDRLYQDGIVVLSKKLNWALWWFDANIIDRWLVDGWSLLVRSWSIGARWIDNNIVDGTVDAFGKGTWVMGSASRMLQAGKIQFYVCVTFGVVAVVMLALLLK